MLIVSVGGWFLKMIKQWREEGQFDDTGFARTLLVRDEVTSDNKSFFIPPPDFLNDIIFGYNFDEDMLLGDKRYAAQWPLIEYLKGKTSGAVGKMIDVFMDKEKEEREEEEDENGEEEVVEGRKEKKNGRDLASIYADFVKMLAISLTFGLVSPMIGFVAAIGISCR